MYLRLWNQFIWNWFKKAVSKKKLLIILCIFLLPSGLALGSLMDVIFIGKSVSFQIPAEITFDLDFSNIESNNIYIRKSKNDLEGLRIDKSHKEFKAIYAFLGY